ncbi:unnamed protein product, partial [Ectocarpus sp. 12 AP-2014]
MGRATLACWERRAERGSHVRWSRSIFSIFDSWTFVPPLTTSIACINPAHALASRLLERSGPTSYKTGSSLLARKSLSSLLRAMSSSGIAPAQQAQREMLTEPLCG